MKVKRFTPLLAAFLCPSMGGCGHSSASASSALAVVATASAAGAIDYVDARHQDEEHLAERRPRRPAEPSAEQRAACTHVRLRVQTTDDYGAQRASAERNFSRAVREANALLADQAVPVCFEIASFERWPLATSGVPRDKVLRALEAHDPGEGVDLVVGQISRTGSFVPTKLDDIGYARILGRHVVVRALAGDAWAQAAQGGPRASFGTTAEAAAAEHDRLAAVILLHEWAHSLGLVHSLDDGTVMAPDYGRGHDHFDAIGRRILVAMTVDPESPGVLPPLRVRLARLLQLVALAPAGAFVARESEDLLARLDEIAETQNSPGAQSEPEPKPKPSAVAFTHSKPTPLHLITTRLHLDPPHPSNGPSHRR